MAVWTTSVEDVTTSYKTGRELKDAISAWLVQLHLRITNRRSVTLYNTSASTAERCVLSIYQHDKNAEDKYENNAIRIYVKGSGVMDVSVKVDKVAGFITSYIAFYDVD